MFKHEKSPVVSSAALESAQLMADPKTEAPGAISELYITLSLAETHPWHASNGQLLKLAKLAVAYSNDRFAEILQNVGVSNQKVSPDIASFALALTVGSNAMLHDAKCIRTSVDLPAMTEEDITIFNPENMLPYWPFDPAPDREGYPYWQLDPAVSSYTPVASRSFIEATILAGRELQGDTNSYLKAVPSQTTPPEYADFAATILDDVLDVANIDLDSADGVLLGAQTSDPDSLRAAYHYAHDGYVRSMLGFEMVFLPAVYGIDFLPER
jgi:hypothetical protein